MSEIKKKILIFSPAIYPCAIGGLEIFNFYLVNELAKTKPVIVATSCKVYFNHSNEIMKLLNNIFILRRFKLSKLSLIISGFFQIALRHRDIGVIHVPYTSSTGILCILFLLVNKILKIPYIVYIHGGGMKPWRIKIIHRIFFKYADRIIAVSETIKNEYEKRSGKKLQVVLPLIPLTKSINSIIDLKRSFSLDMNDKVILVVGSIKPLKGSDIVLKSFINLGIEFIKKEKLKLIYVGDGQQRKTLESVIHDFNEFNEHVQFWGNLPNDKLSDVYKVANIYVIASWFEGTPKTLLEAMFNGLPIIGTNVNGINNIIFDNKNGLLFEKNNYHDLKDKIVSLVNNNSLAALLGRNAEKEFINKYCFTKTIEAFNIIYDKYLLSD